MQEHILWAGPNKPWGSVEAATELWLRLGINHIMITHAPREDFRLINTDGSIPLEGYERLSKLQEQLGVVYHFHPYNLQVRNQLLMHPSAETLPRTRQFLKDLDNIISDYGFYPLITCHLPFLEHSCYNVCLDENAALQAGAELFCGLELKSLVALENTFTPGHDKRHTDISLLGYKPEHFTKIINGQANYGLCIDVGHMNLCDEPTKNFLSLPVLVYSVHLHGNDGIGDYHLMPTEKSVKDMEGTIRAIKECQGPVVFEIVPLYAKYSESDIREGLEYWKHLAGD